MKPSSRGLLYYIYQKHIVLLILSLFFVRSEQIWMDKMAVVSKERRAAGTLTQQHSCYLGDGDTAVVRGNDPCCRTKHPPNNPRSSREERHIACGLHVSHEAFKSCLHRHIINWSSIHLTKFVQYQINGSICSDICPSFINYTLCLHVGVRMGIYQALKNACCRKIAQYWIKWVS